MMFARRGVGPPIFFVAFAAGLVAACGTVDFNSLIAIFDAKGIKIIPCVSTSTSKVIARIQNPLLVQNSIRVAWRSLPANLKDDVVIRAALSQAESVPLKIQQAGLGYVPPENEGPTVLEIPSPVTPLVATDFYRTANLISEYAIRQSAPAGASYPFLQALTTYYETFYAGPFYTYFSAPYSKPVISLTINDSEITQSVGVFFEFLFDYALKSPVWYTVSTDGKNTKKYYPGESSSEPTVAALAEGGFNYQRIVQPINISSPVELPNHCHMTTQKAEVINYVAQKFATAASSESALAIRSAGGLGVSLGLFGKLSIGDNNTLSMLAKTVVSEITLRVTTQVAYTALSQFDIETVNTRVMSRDQKAQQIQDIASLFVSPNK